MWSLYNEVDLKYILNSTLNRVNILKSNSIMIKKPKIEFYFLFENIIDPDLERIYENLFILWFFTGQKFKVSKVRSKLVRGMRYYRFFLRLNFIFNISFFKFFEVFSYSLKPFIGKNFFSNIGYDINNSWYFLTNIRGFNNIRLLDYFYLIGIYDDLIIHFFTKNPNNNYFKSSYYFLSLFKGC